MPIANDSQSVFHLLENHVPGPSLAYAHELWIQSPFQFKLTKNRQTKVGDFTCKSNAAHVRITVNHDLNPYLFLLTYVHEVAHLRVFLKHGSRAEAHGQHWKSTFQELLGPLLRETVFPPDILHELSRHMENPKASSFADIQLTQVLRSYDPHAKEVILLSSIPEGSIFKLQGRYFKKGQLRRTRVICREVKSKRNFLVPMEAPVTDVQISIF